MLSIYDWFGYDLPLRERYQMIHRAGFDGVMLFWSDEFGRGEYGPGNYRACVGYAREAGLYVENVHAPVGGQQDLWMDTLAGQAVLDCYLQCLEDCATFQIPTLVLHLPDDSYKPTPLAACRVEKLADRAERLGVNLAAENLDDVANLAFVLESTGSSRVGFCYDSCHHRNYAPGEDLLGRYGSRLMALHLHDNGGERRQHSLPFDGELDWPATMEAIAQTGYQGATSLEPMNWGYEALSPEEFLCTAVERAWQLASLRGPAAF